ncbi:MAG TPA: VWA domain-containing protein [Thermoanaerobaculia bacterium]|nr:VWA domain-containing protein [Thermoanaerobaculia bacterium]
MHALMLAAALMAQQYEETITVSRVLVDVRVTDHQGNAITGLTPADFHVRIGGKPATIESLEWLDDTGGAAAAPAAEESRAEARPASRPRGRLFVVFVQTDFARNNFRLVGQMHFNRYADEFIASLAPEDRVAVFSFDSHLKFRRDFTSDKEDLGKALREALLIDRPPPPPAVPSPSLAPRLDREAMRRVTTSEDALLLVANALSPIDGPKQLLLIGWGLGRYSRGTVWMLPEWKATRAALDAARVTIFSLDTAWADYHDLELGLQSAARETGGFYAKTYKFAGAAVERLQRTLAGHYELELRVPQELKPGTHRLDVRVKRRGITVLAPSTVIARP